MKKRINLFSQRIDNQTATKFILYGIRATYGVLLFGVVALVVVTMLYVYFSRSVTELEKTKSTYNRYILANTIFNKEIQRFLQKYTLLNGYLKNDVKGFQYYLNVLSIIQPLDVADNLESFTIDTSRKVTFSLAVPEYKRGLEIISFFEQESVLEKFDALSLESFNISPNSTTYQLSFTGVLKELE
ncbi:hypothetical protein COU87_04920 [Candidatus Roizmanbacteria bacterium CG10_big_fil_rev_8_21_14_0_10_39_12]|uniref:PilN domain-containing protein n=1 Tax=Candidatus Roizmanbacteria bacterium CG10_big_fil_rev_8_21_14_0_10_39_12 TaxID=1974852 RepID=A0A2M8KN81_9BACT|nr:MAG: hypothetical protein COU87_04920 [Candidatus Roizmanbacteria bacterium CG10_big_fil_rev_8_21_14_0_10_39_12]